MRRHMSKGRQALLAAITKETGILSPLMADACVEAVLTGILKVVEKKKKLSLPGFGTFKLLVRPARKARNPMTGETVRVAAEACVVFRAERSV